MGTIKCTRDEVFETLSECVGYKSGLILSNEQIVLHLGEWTSLLEGDRNEIIRIRSEEYEEMTMQILYKIGSISNPRLLPPPIALYHEHKDDAKLLDIAMQVVGLLTEMYPALETKTTEGPVDLAPFIDEAKKRLGGKGWNIALEYYCLIEEYLHALPWAGFRRFEWQNTIQLKQLFESEQLGALYGTFMDQRYIDYLYRNDEAIEHMNWRKFEGLTCEYFERRGFRVEIGSGRNDGNIDARVWADDVSPKGPPLIIVQCKRAKEKVGKVIVKALWADIQNEGAKSGLIVTSSELAPGARKLSVVRGYPISEANRETLRKWIGSMCSPAAGDLPHSA